jgi:hypothetical protein
VGAMGADGENLGSGLNQKDGIIADMADQPAIDEVSARDALCQIGAVLSGCFVGHGRLV